jgi:Restriction endonuclease XhoI/Domain of unknown function (DUF4263)
VTPHPAEQAIRDFWHAREEQARQLRGPVDSTSFAGIRQRTWAVVDAVIEELVGCGVPRASIRRDPRLGLPSAYLPTTRRWDLLVLDDGIPVAAMDFRFQMGSAGKNLANRVGEFVSQAADLQRAYQHASVRPFKPCLGLFFVLEENEELTRPRRWHGEVSPASESETGRLSYRDQYAQSFRRLLNDGMYDAVCYLTTTRPPDFSISEPFPEMGFSRFVTVIAQRIEEIKQTRRHSGLDAVTFGQLLAQRDDLPEVMSGLTSTPAGLSAAESAVIQQRRQVVSHLRELALDPGTDEAKMQAEIGECYWLFGGQYVRVAERRDLVPLDEHDIPLVCADGSLQLVELKRPDSRLVKKYRNHLIPSGEVHEAVSQCQHYLRSLDEMGPSLRTLHRNELGLDYDYRRARGTVVVGHQERVQLPGVTREQIDQCIRSYNADRTRVQVVTYADLLDAAERALKFDAELPGTTSTPPRLDPPHRT